MKHLIIITIYNKPTLTKHCLESIAQTTDLSNHKLFLIDDHSNAQTKKVIKLFYDRHPETIIQYNKKNLGKPKSVNIALRRFPEMDHYTIIDNDITLKSKGWTTKLFRAHRDWNNQTILGAKTYMDGFPIIKNGRRYLDPWPFWNLAGCFFSFPKKIFKKLGYFFDKSHRSEDADYCRRAYLAGFHWYYVTAIKATISHYKHHQEHMLLRRRELMQMGIRRKWSDYVMHTHQVYYPPRKTSINRLS